MNEIEAFGVIDNLCENLFKDHKWKITKYEINNETAFVNVSVIKNTGIKEIIIKI